MAKTILESVLGTESFSQRDILNMIIQSMSYVFKRRIVEHDFHLYFL